MTFRDIYKREPIRDWNWIVPFGKYQGQTLQFVLDEDPQYLIWLALKTDIDFHDDLMEKIELTADEIATQSFEREMQREIKSAFPPGNDWSRD